MKFQKEMIDAAYKLEVENNYCVLQCCYGSAGLTETEKQNLALAHYKKINISDAIYVVNVGGYIGESVKAEIEYAKKHGKEIIYHEEKNNFDLSFLLRKQKENVP